MQAFIILALLAVVRAQSSGYSYTNSQNGGYVNNIVTNSLLTDTPSFGSYRSGYGGQGELTKEFYTYSAPESEFNDHGKNVGDVASSLKQRIRVIFIKGPESNGLENAALNLANTASNSRTAIYILTKQSDIGDLSNKLQTLNNYNPNKPEVHFVKYRTQQDATNAQHQIRSQYDALGGTSNTHNGGIAPVLNFASKATHQAIQNGQVGGVSNTYIPPPSVRVTAPRPLYLPSIKQI